MAISSDPGAPRSAVRRRVIWDWRVSRPLPVLAETRIPLCDCLDGRSDFVKIVRTFVETGSHSFEQGSSGCVESMRARIRSAFCIAVRVRVIPSSSTGSLEARKPAVSMSRTGKPARTIDSSTVSRVVPGIGLTRALSMPKRALRRLDFPALGGPASTRR